MADNTHNNDAFEEFFKKKAEEFDISYQEQDWLKLEKKLELRDAQISYRRKIRWIAAASILIIAVMGYFTYDNYNKINQINQALSENITSPEESETIPETPDESNNILPDFKPIPAEGLAEQQEETKRNESTSPKNTEQLAVSENNTELSNGLDPEPRKVNIARQSLEKSALAGQINTGRSTGTPGKYIASVQARNLYPGIGGAASQSKVNQSAASRITLSLLVSPDLSTVGAVSGFYDPGYKIGMTLNYRLSSKMILTTGVIHSNIRYSARGNDYTPSSDLYISNNNGFSLREVIAECLILDIPLNLNYEIKEFRRSKLFASAGLSSYLMMNEEYDFSYDNYHPEQTESWSGQTGAFHLFNNAGFSVGYQMEVNPRWSLQVEPFLKIPLKEIGWGNVKLYSMGSFVSVNYHL